MSNYTDWYIFATTDVARQALERMASTATNVRVRLWLYYRPQGLEFAVASESEGKPEGFELVTGESLPVGETLEGLTYWIRSKTQSVPVLPGRRPRMGRR